MSDHARDPTSRPSPLRVCLAGATGWAGSALALGIRAAADLELVAAVSRSAAGSTLGDALARPELVAPVYATLDEALAIPSDVVFDYTHPDVARQHALAALAAGRHVVVGTSGLDEDAYAEIDSAADKADRGALAVGNFALTVVLLQKFAEMAARLVPSWEIIDYASASKPDAPSGTARELAQRLGAISASRLEVPIGDTLGEPATRGARLDGTQVHAVRLPGFVLGVEAIFGMPDQKLVLRHEAGSSAAPYVEGALLAIREVGRLSGLHRGLDAVMDFGS